MSPEGHGGAPTLVPGAGAVSVNLGLGVFPEPWTCKLLVTLICGLWWRECFREN